MYAAFSAFILNLLLAIILTPVFEAMGVRRGRDITKPTDYDEELAPVEPVETGRQVLG
jgi:SSS family solute:Na+ symporter